MVTGCVLADGVRVPAGTVLDGQAVAPAGAGDDGEAAPPPHETRLGDLRMAPL